MRFVRICIVTFGLPFAVGCGSPSFLHTGPSKSEFYENCVQLAEESFDGYTKLKGPWVSAADPELAAKRLERERKADDCTAKIVELRKKVEQHESAKPEYPELNQLTTENLDKNRNRVVDHDELPPGVFVDEYSFFHYTDSAQNELLEWQQELARLEEEIRRLDDEQYANLFGGGPDETDRREYLMTVGDIRSRLGQPDSILKDDLREHTWVYRFADGSVRLKVGKYGNSNSSLDHDETLATLNPHTVEMQ